MKVALCKCGRLVTYPERRAVLPREADIYTVTRRLKTCRCGKQFLFAQMQGKPRKKAAK